MTQDGPAGLRILVVEDETLIAGSDRGRPEGSPLRRRRPGEQARRRASDGTRGALDAAILDVRIRGGQVYPVTEQVLARKIPFLLVSGPDDWALPESLRDQPRLTKPFWQHDLEQQIRLLMAKARASIT